MRPYLPKNLFDINGKNVRLKNAVATKAICVNTMVAMIPGKACAVIRVCIQFKKSTQLEASKRLDPRKGAGTISKVKNLITLPSLISAPPPSKKGAKIK